MHFQMKYVIAKHTTATNEINIFRKKVSPCMSMRKSMHFRMKSVIAKHTTATNEINILSGVAKHIEARTQNIDARTPRT